ncbi:MAG: hypothetical protein HYX69_06925 [Planctomycetia bacterium]|nr:hypothetical protein [Planctomycetia bacterium]
MPPAAAGSCEQTAGHSLAKRGAEFFEELLAPRFFEKNGKERMAARSDIQAGRAYVELVLKNSKFITGLRDAGKRLKNFGAPSEGQCGCRPGEREGGVGGRSRPGR